MARANNLVSISPARGLGAMVAFDIFKERGSDVADAEQTARIVLRAYQNG